MASFLLSSSFSHAAVIASWDFENNLTSDPAYNVIGASGITYGSGVDGNAAYFSGTSSYIDLGDNNSTLMADNADFTVSMWIKSDQLTNQALISFDDDSGWFLRTTIYTDSTGIRAAYTNGQNQTAIAGFDVNYLDVWTHVALTQDFNDGTGNTVLSLFINGVLSDSSSVTSSGQGRLIDSGDIGRYHIRSDIAAFDPLQSSGSLVGNGSFYSGGMDSLVIHDQLLSASEIDQLATLQTVSAPSVLAYMSLFGLFVMARRNVSP